MKTRNGHLIWTFVFAAGTAAMGTGCVVHAQASGAAEATAPVVFVGPPTLVAVDGDIWVVRDADYPVYYVDDDYWVIRDGVWYRSHAYDGGWVVVEASVVPTTIVSRNHTTYIHYRGSGEAKTRPAPRPGEAVAATAPASPPPAHDEKPGVGNERKEDGDQPGHNPHTQGPAKDEASAPGVGNERKSDGAQPGQVGRGGRAVSPPEMKRDRKHDKDHDKDHDGDHGRGHDGDHDGDHGRGHDKDHDKK
jgi:hypothetical protein